MISSSDRFGKLDAYVKKVESGKEETYGPFEGQEAIDFLDNFSIDDAN